jgi:hypothetical protein
MPEQQRESTAEQPRRYPKLDDIEYDRVNAFLKKYVDFTAREWAVATLCADFRTGTGVEMTNLGEHLPEMVPFVTEPYTASEVYSARNAFREKTRRAASTFLYGAFSGLLTAEEVDDVMYEATEVAKFLLEIEGRKLAHEDERRVEAQVREAMEELHEASVRVRYDQCPHCGERLGIEEANDD